MYVWLVRKGLLCCVSSWDGSSQKTEAPFPNSGGELSKQLEAALARAYLYWTQAPPVIYIHSLYSPYGQSQAIRTLLHSLVAPQWHHLGQACHFSAPPSSAC